MKVISHLGKTAGCLREDKVFITKRKEIHIFRKYNGLGISFKVLMDLYKRGCKKIIFLLERKDNVERYEAHINTFFEYGKIYTDSKHDTQRILRFKYLNQKFIY